MCCSVYLRPWTRRAVALKRSQTLTRTVSCSDETRTPLVVKNMTTYRAEGPGFVPAALAVVLRIIRAPAVVVLRINRALAVVLRLRASGYYSPLLHLYTAKTTMLA